MLSEPKKNACLCACRDSSEKAKNAFLALNGPNLLKMVPDFVFLQGLTYMDSMKYFVSRAKNMILKIGF